MARHLFAFAIWFVILWCAWAYPCLASAANVEADDIVWTVIIPDAFPRDVYTWHVRSDGTYREDGRDALNGNAVEPTLSGRWRLEGGRMVLRQDGLPYVFDGVIEGEAYTGMLYFNGRQISRFCAARAENVPDCDAAAKVARTGLPFLPTKAAVDGSAANPGGN